MSIDLTECRAKIDRAHEHRDRLYAVVRRARPGGGEAKLFQMDAKLDPQSGYHVFRLAAMPEDWLLQVGVILGNVVHNLRCALEYLFYGLCRHYLGVPKTERLGGQVQFPIEDDPQTIINKRVHFREIPGTQWAIIDWAQPYQGLHPPPRAIKALRDISNGDKHRVLNPPLLTTLIVDYTDKVPTERVIGEWIFPDLPQRLEVGTEVMRVPFPPDTDAEMEVAGHVYPNVRLPKWDTQFVSGVDAMIFAVSLVVDLIEAEL